MIKGLIYDGLELVNKRLENKTFKKEGKTKKKSESFMIKGLISLIHGLEFRKMKKNVV
jgi:hypothetical protein